MEEVCEISNKFEIEMRDTTKFSTPLNNDLFKNFTTIINSFEVDDFENIPIWSM